MEEDICLGGQGRSSESVESEGRICGWLLIAFVMFALVGCSILERMDAVPSLRKPGK